MAVPRDLAGVMTRKGMFGLLAGAKREAVKYPRGVAGLTNLNMCRRGNYGFFFRRQVLVQVLLTVPPLVTVNGRLLLASRMDRCCGLML